MRSWKSTMVFCFTNFWIRIITLLIPQISIHSTNSLSFFVRLFLYHFRIWVLGIFLLFIFLNTFPYYYWEEYLFVILFCFSFCSFLVLTTTKYFYYSVTDIFLPFICQLWNCKYINLFNITNNSFSSNGRLFYTFVFFSKSLDNLPHILDIPFEVWLETKCI